MAPRKPKGWVPPAGLKIEVGVSRGDVFLKTEAAVGDALNVARLLVAMVRQIAVDAPDVLPHADSVPGSVLPYDWMEEYADGGKGRIGIGFRKVGPKG
jgi:hypothetical protein